METQAAVSSGSPKKAWHMILMYPTLFVALIGAVPEFTRQINAFRRGIPTENLNLEKEQRQLWEKNFDCTQKNLPQIVVTEQKFEIEVTTCRSGDILVITRKPGVTNPTTRWISTGDKTNV